MAILCFDIEADNLYEDVTKVWCISIKDLTTGVNTLYGPEQISAGLKHLSIADWLIAHNGIDYDLRALKKVCGWVPKPGCVIRDSLIWAKLAHLDLDVQDQKSKKPEVKELNGSHSLKSWGIRLGHHKLDYQGGFDTYSEEMGIYCQQDVETLAELTKHLKLQNVSEEALELEHVFAQIVTEMSSRGFSFDLEKAQQLYERLEQDQNNLVLKVTDYIPASIKQMKTPAYWELVWKDGFGAENRERRPTRGECESLRKQLKIKGKDCEYLPGPVKTKEIPFNPNSAKQVREYLYEKYQWVSPELTEAGEKALGSLPTVDLARKYGSLKEDVLRDFPEPEGQLFADYRLVVKAKSFLKGKKKAASEQEDGEEDGEEEYSGWLSQAVNGRIHHRMDSLGCVTTRCSHSKPNLGQVPSVVSHKEKGILWGIEGRYGADCRSLFTCTPGYIQVGTDISGIEARALAHYLAPYDGGAYIQEVLQGDIHQLNVNSFEKKAGFKIKRGDSKTIFYGWCYGAGDMKLGKQMASPVSGSTDAAQEFTRLRDFYRRTPGRITQQVWSDALGKRRTATPEEAAYITIGSKVRNALESGIGGLSDLLQILKLAAERKYVRVLDRKLPVRSPHSVLNTVLQGAAAIIGKRWVVTLNEQAAKQGIEHHLLAYVHDERQDDVKEGQEDVFMPLSVDCIRQAGEFYDFRIPLTGEAHSGKCWTETH